MAQTKPKAGQFYGVSGNGTDGQFLRTDGAGGMSWAAPIVQPTLTSIDYPGTANAADPAGGENVIINGTNFQSGITCTVGGTSATTALNSGTQITITSPAKAAGQYTVTVTNTDGGTASQANFIQYSGVPIWSTASGSLGSVNEGASASFQVTATEGSDTIEYAVTTGSLPSGLSLATATGAITGTAGAVSTDTTTTFGITATDDENQTSSERSFSITVNNDNNSNYFNTVLYNGTSASQSITGVNFQPDWVWIKRRSSAENSALYDSNRGINKQLESNTSNAEATNTAPYEGFTAFNSDGFTVDNNGGTNSSGQTYVAWNWKVNGGTTSSNSDGDIISTVQVNDAKGISIVTYTTNGSSSARVGHGLATTPSVVLIKNRSASGSWHFMTTAVDGSFDDFIFDSNSQKSDSSLSAPTSTTFASESGAASNTRIAYCMHDVAGYQKIGTYVGARTNDVFVETGFEPAWVIIKAVDATDDWFIVDNKRDGTIAPSKALLVNSNAQESDFTNAIQFATNGFQVVGSANSGGTNNSGTTFLYWAIAGDSSSATPTLANSQKTTLFTGRNTTVTGVGFKPDMVIVANRAAANGSFLLDSLRGAERTLWPPGNYFADSRSSVTAFNSDGVTIGSYTSIGTGNNVLWSWKAGIARTINTDGAVTSILSVNQAAGFSMVKWNGTGSATTVGHGLGVVPQFIIVKNLDQNEKWRVYNNTSGATKYMSLNDDYGEGTASTIWNDTAPTSTVFSIGTDTSVNGNGDKLIAYCWASIANYSKVGTYVGSSSALTVNVGFAPSFAIFKRIDAAATGGWRVFDTVRGTDKSYTLNSSAAEYDDTANYVDFTSTGFSFSTSQQNPDINANGGNYIYIAFKQT